jgi:hypothetical protein
LRADVENLGQHALQIVPDVHRVNPQCGDTLPRHPTIPRLVALWMIAELMPKAIDLDREQGVMTIEVEHIRSQRMLAAELEAIRPFAK